MSGFGNGEQLSKQDILFRRTIKLGILAVTGVLALYVAAGKTAERTPLQMPADAIKLPWPNSGTEAFLVPAGTAAQANCGHLETFLGAMYDDSSATAIDATTMEAYGQIYERAPGEHTVINTAAMRLALAEIPDGQVVLCPPSPSVDYLRP